MILCSTTGNELLEVWYYGDLLTVKGEPQSYIIDSDEAPGLVTARDPESGEEFVIFDGGRHGYDNMFCDEHDPSELEHRPLKRYEIPASKLVLELGYSIDYEDEKETFEPDEADTVELINGERMPWEQAKRDGIMLTLAVRDVLMRWIMYCWVARLCVSSSTTIWLLILRLSC